VDAPDLRPLPLGDSDVAQVGEMVLAIGNPLGLAETVTSGIISAKGRSGGLENVSELIQTDAAINMGNSGGPLINMRGELVGINTMIVSRTGQWMGIGFAVPVNTARFALESILKFGRVQRGLLGVEIQPWTPDLLRQFGRRQPDGVLVAVVTNGSSAAEAGIRPGDVIESYDGKPIPNLSELRRFVFNTPPGQRAKVEIERRGKKMGLDAVIRVPGVQPVAAMNPGPTNEVGQLPSDGVLAGVEVRASGGPGGVAVVNVAPRSPAARGLQPGDVILEINQEPVTDMEAYAKLSSAIGSGNGVLLLVQRSDRQAFVTLSP